MSKQIRFVIGNKHDTATLTASSNALPITNTQLSERSLVWRSTSAEEQMIEGELDAGEMVGCLAIMRHNFGPSFQCKIEFFNGDTQVYNSGYFSTAMLIPAGVWRAGVDPWGASRDEELPNNVPVTIVWLEQSVLVSRYKITLIDSLNKDGFMQIGRIVLGDVFSPTNNFAWSPKITWIETGEQRVTEGGSLRTSGLGDLRRKLEIQLDWLDAADRFRFISALGKSGMGADILVSAYPDSNDEFLELEGLILCRREQVMTITHNLPNNWQLPLTFLEV